MSSHSELDIIVDRDSVSAGDDCDSHEVLITIPRMCPVQDFLFKFAWKKCPLPKIHGGSATWLIISGEEPEASIGVMAQQWEYPRLLISEFTTLDSIYKDKNSRRKVLYFRYYSHADPVEIYKLLLFQQPLPDRFT
ncbi:hypothetical protein [Gimesia chilikensis]|uniref:hypothetical protein n=1 Tax=Gimesia chilikensis TaxID=2605989 RepID=UPI00118D1C8D|nr:hypothetical protein [Gimesia chilikensis]QDT88328.1 hypothetical protein MalM14_60250 [Gimesia chilikensis]